jgi:hypothetical protein
MTTKITIAFGPDFHFYHEVADDDHVYLEVDGQVVRIPLPVWAVIRRSTAVDLALADLSDEQLRRFAEQVMTVGRETFGMDDPSILDTPAAEQIAEELAILTRERQREILAPIAELERLNRRTAVASRSCTVSVPCSGLFTVRLAPATRSIMPITSPRRPERAGCCRSVPSRIAWPRLPVSRRDCYNQRARPAAAPRASIEPTRSSNAS